MVTQKKSSKDIYRLKVAALSDYWKFLDLLEFKGGTSKFGKLHQELSVFVSDSAKRRKLVLMPRGHFKSTICSVGYVLWRIYKNPNIRVIVGTATGDLAKSFIREIKQYFEDETLQETVWNDRPHISGRLVPIMDRTGSSRRSRRGDVDEEGTDTETADKKVIWRGDAIQVLRDKIMKEPTVVAASVGAPNTGFHYDLAIFDDLINFDNANTESKRERLYNWVGDIESVLDPFDTETQMGEEVVTIGTRYFKRDLYGMMLGEDCEDEEELEDWLDPDLAIWSRNIYVNGRDDSDGYIFPERFNAEVLERIKRRLLKQPNGIRRWASQYLNAIMTDDEQILKPGNIQYIHPNCLKVSEGFIEVRLNQATAPIQVKPFLVIDPAISQKKAADNTVVAVGGLDAEHNFYLFDMKLGKFSPDETVRYSYELLDKWKLRSLHVDSEKLGLSLIHLFRSKFKDYRPIVLNEYKAQGEKKARIATFLEPLFANHKLYMLTWMGGLKQLMEEIEFFPREGVHDDTLDAMAMIAHVAMPTRNRQKKANYTPKKVRNLRYGGIR